MVVWMSKEDFKYGVWRDNFAKIADKSDKRNILQYIAIQLLQDILLPFKSGIEAIASGTAI